MGKLQNVIKIKVSAGWTNEDIALMEETLAKLGPNPLFMYSKKHNFVLMSQVPVQLSEEVFEYVQGLTAKQMQRLEVRSKIEKKKAEIDLLQAELAELKEEVVEEPTTPTA